MAVKTETFHVSGMSCQHCVQSIKSMVNKLQGIKSIDVSLKQGTVSVSYEEGKSNTEAIEGAIVGAGYDIVKNR